MRNLTVAAVLFLAVGAFAQEIGSEIPPPADKNAPLQPNNPWAAPPPPPVSTKVSAGAGSFGIHAGFGADAELPVVSTPSATSTTKPAPKLGVTWFLGDSFALEANLGFGLGLINSLTVVNFGLGVAADIYFRPPTAALRPFFTVGAGVDLYISGGRFDTGVNAQAGIGATYFLSPQFGISGKILLVAPFLFTNSGVTIGIFTLSPGVTAHWFF